MFLERNRINSGNYENEPISVEFLMLHYTACNWETVKTIFEHGNVSSHFLIDIDGAIDEVIPALTSQPLKAWHAGEGQYVFQEKSWEIGYKFNNITLGVELVNYNGNLLDYSHEQYEALGYLILELRKKYPILNDPNRIIGHEHTAFYRGKADPGIRFDWERMFKQAGYKHPFPNRQSMFPRENLQEIINYKKSLNKDGLLSQEQWQLLSKHTENLTKKYYSLV